MSGFRVDPGELGAAAGRLRATASALRDAAGGDLAGPGSGRDVLDQALARFAAAWREGHGRLAEGTEDVATRLDRAAAAYAEAERQVARAAAP